MSERRVIIVGGGFGGATLAQHLERKLTSETEIVLISSGNYFVFTPMLAEVVGRSISPSHMAVVGRQMVRRTTWLTADAGVDVRLNCGAQEITAAGVRLKTGELIEAGTVVSTIGTSPNPLIQKLGLPLQHGRLITNPDMSVPGAPNVWALGDVDLLQVASMDGSGRVVEVMSPLDVILKAIEPMTETRGDDRRRAS